MNKNENSAASSYIEALMQTFLPALSEAETTHWFSTDEVYDAIKKISPGAGITKEEVYDAMIAAGFRFQCRPGALALDFKWMLKQNILKNTHTK